MLRQLVKKLSSVSKLILLCEVNAEHTDRATQNLKAIEVGMPKTFLHHAFCLLKTHLDELYWIV